MLRGWSSGSPPGGGNATRRAFLESRLPRAPTRPPIRPSDMVHYPPSGPMLDIILLITGLVLASGVVTMFEAAIFSVSLSRVHLAVEQKRGGAKRLLRIKQNMQRPIGTMVILNNVVNIGGSVYSGQLAGELFGVEYLDVFTVVLTMIVILLGEIYPKTIGERFAEPIAMWAAPLILWITWIFFPVIWLLEKLTLPLTMGRVAQVVSKDEIRALANVGNTAGSLSRHESDLIGKVFRLNDVTARDIMTHRLMLSYLPADQKLSELDLDDIQRLH